MADVQTWSDDWIEVVEPLPLPAGISEDISVGSYRWRVCLTQVGSGRQLEVAGRGGAALHNTRLALRQQMEE